MELYASTECVYAIGSNDNVVVRPNADVIIDRAHYFGNLEDIGGFVPVESGLTVRDFAVFLKYVGYPEGRNILEDAFAGYIVGSVDPSDGSGVLVHEDIIDVRPSGFASPELIAKLQLIDAIDEDTLVNDFGLSGLANYIKRSKLKR